MIEIDDRWVYAVVAVVAGLSVGAVTGWVARRWLSSAKRRLALQTIAVPASIFLFWIATATGVLFAIGANSPETLRPIPRNIIDWVPDALIAGLLVLAGIAAGIAVSGTVGKALQRATGQQHPGVQRSIRWAITGGAVILALGQLGVQTTILVVLVAGVVFGFSATLALIAGLGGRHVASNIAASRSLRTELLPGARIDAAGVSGVIVDLNSTTLVVRTADDRRMLIPYGILLNEPFEVGPFDNDDSV